VPSRAANGDPVKVGQAHTGTSATTISNIAPSEAAVALKGIVTTTAAGRVAVGVVGQSAGQTGVGVHGLATSAGTATRGVYGLTSNGIGVLGQAIGTSSINYGVYGVSSSSQGHGVYGEVLKTIGFGYGVYGVSKSVQGGGGVYASGRWAALCKGTLIGVYGLGDTAVFGLGSFRGVSGSGGTYGVRGIGEYGVYGSGGVVGVQGSSSSGHAGYFTGKTHVQGTFTATNKQFLIDHPSDPANRTLAHACVEAPEMLNVYRGTVTLNSRGTATVRLPRYFSALNTDVGYQLTAVGAQAPGLYVARETDGKRFVIAGGVPGQRVCWQVMGARRDAWSRKHPLRVERTKRKRDRGKYLNPELFGRPRSAGIHVPPKVPRDPRPPE
jgi:hypothetical protein